MTLFYFKIRNFVRASIRSYFTARFIVWAVFILIFLGFNILKYFIVPVLWAAIIAYMTWPIYLRIQHFLVKTEII